MLKLKTYPQYSEWPNRAGFEKLSSRYLQDHGKSLQARTAASARNCFTHSAGKKSLTLCFVQWVLDNCVINGYSSLGICEANEWRPARVAVSTRGREISAVFMRGFGANIKEIWLRRMSTSLPWPISLRNNIIYVFLGLKRLVCQEILFPIYFSMNERPLGDFVKGNEDEGCRCDRLFHTVTSFLQSFQPTETQLLKR